jgi:hypothetical protein
MKTASTIFGSLDDEDDDDFYTRLRGSGTEPEQQQSAAVWGGQSESMVDTLAMDSWYR